MNTNIYRVTAKDRERLAESLSLWSGKKILIVGDIGVDEYLVGSVRRLSPEAPVPILEVQSQDQRLGMAGNVAQNVLALGGVPLLVSVIGDDGNGQKLKDLCGRVGLEHCELIVESGRPTTCKSRMIAEHHHLLRVDFENRKWIQTETEKLISAKLEKLVASCDAVILQDYAKGMITQAVFKNLVQLSHRFGKKVYVDPHRSQQAGFYSGCDLIKPNFDEALALAGLSYDELRDRPERLLEVGKSLQGVTGAKQLVMTRGKEGMILFDANQVTRVPTFARKVFDVTGAGDTVISALTLALAAGLNLQDSCAIANFAAGVVVGEVGCVACRREDLKNYILSPVEVDPR